MLGYLHRGDEKIAENMTYNQFVPTLTGWTIFHPLPIMLHTLLRWKTGIDLPERCEAIRVLVCEMARISSHLLGMSVFGMDAGAWTPFMYTFTEREKLYTLFEELTGARFTTSSPVLVESPVISQMDGWTVLLIFVTTCPRLLTKLKSFLLGTEYL